MKNPSVSRRKEIFKMWAEINEKETMESIAKINKTNIWLFEKVNRQTISQTHQEKKGRRMKSAKLEMKMEKSQPTTQKYKGS